MAVIDPTHNPNDLIGKHIFHTTKGSVPMVGMPPYGGKNIGDYLGQVCEVTSPSRIFYLSKNNERKYVSLAGVGIVCDSIEDADELCNLRNTSMQKYRNLMTEIGSEIESTINKLKR